MDNKPEVYRTAAIKLRGVRNAINEYNNFAMKHHLYVMCIGPPGTDDLLMAENGIPQEVLREVYEK